jgi:serine/threonine protein kinase
VLRAGRLPVPIHTAVIGAKIEGFVIVRELARGGMGIVYLAEHHRLKGLKKVIKLLLPEFAARPDVRARFEREASAASRLRHKRILGIDSFGEAEGQLWLMTPFLEGMSLSDHLRRFGPLSRDAALRVLLQLCAALDHAHRALVIHRDLKPSNIFLCPDDAEPWAIQLLDFGIAKIIEHQDAADTRTGHVVGTPHYMPPEAYEGSRGVTQRADIYSTAVIAHELVTGVRPWDTPEESAPGILYFVQKTTRPILRIPEWQDVLTQALSVDPARRQSDARTLALALAAKTPGGAEALREVAPELTRETSAPHRALADDITIRHNTGTRMVTPSDSRIVSGEFTTTTMRMATTVIPRQERSVRWSFLVVVALLVCLLAGTTTFTMVRIGRPKVQIPVDAGSQDACATLPACK